MKQHETTTSSKNSSTLSLWFANKPSGAQGPASQCDSRRLVSRKFAGSSRLTRLQSTISPSLRHLTCVAKSLIFLIRKRMDFWRTTGNKTQPCHKLTRTRGNGGSLRWSSAAPPELMARPLQGLPCLGGFASRQRMICSVCSKSRGRRLSDWWTIWILPKLGIMAEQSS